MKPRIALFILFSIVLTGCNRLPVGESEIRITSAETSGKISPLIYGHFYEHIYHSANGGLWGDLVWNRSFEEYLSTPEWKTSGGILTQSAKFSDIKLVFGNPGWTDYEFSLEARKESGYEGFLILFRASDEDNFYWVNLGGWGNSQHAIEKEVDGNRSVATPFAEGSVPENKWLPIRVLVKGNTFECYLDNHLVITHTDTAATHAKGMVGVGSWSTAVSYRNLKVTGLNGETLWSGMPELPSNEVIPRHWIPSGPGTVRVMKEDALNGMHCLLFDPGTGESVIVQKDFGVRPGDPVQGSIWLKGAPEARVLVRIKGDGKVLAEQNIGNLTGVWAEYPVSLEVAAFTAQEEGITNSAGIAGLSLEISCIGRVWVDQVSMMAESARKNGGFRTDLYDAVAGIRPTVIRWPGGCFAELYRWKDGIGPQHKRRAFPVNMWDDKDVNSLGTDEFITLCRNLDAEPLIVINSGFHEGAGTPEAWEPWVKEACEWLEYCNGPASSTWGAARAANGHPEPYGVKYWEIDNELWRSRVPDAHIYSQAVKIFSSALRKVDPSIILIAHGGNGTDMEWNQVVLDEAAGFFDILSIHHYSDPDKFYQAAIEQDSLYKNLRKSVAASENPSIKIYVSEWNAQSTDWRTGLYAGNLLNFFEQNSDLVTIAGPALFLRHTSAGAWDNAFINFDHTGWFPAPNYVVMKLWREHFAPVRLELTGIPDSATAAASFDPEDNRLVLKLVNNSQTDQSLSVILPPDYHPIGAKAFLVKGASLSDRNTMENQNQIEAKDHPVTIQRKKISVNLPGQGCLLIETK